MKLKNGFWWPRGAEKYGRRYITRADDMEMAIRLCKDLRVAVQAGGHVGVWPVWLSSRFKSVVTLEPERLNFIALKRNTKEFGNVSIFNAAIGSERKDVSIKINRKNIGAHQISGRGHIPMVTIDSLKLKGVDFICLDVEGFEFQALLGAAKTIKKSRPVIMLENRTHYKRVGVSGGIENIQSFLNGFGYRLCSSVKMDVIFSV